MVEIKQKVKKEVIELDDIDFLLIDTLQKLTAAIEKLSVSR